MRLRERIYFITKRGQIDEVMTVAYFAGRGSDT